MNHLSRRSLFAAPRLFWVIASAVFILLYVPLLTILSESFFNYQPGGVKEFVGLFWYEKMFRNRSLTAPLLRSFMIAGGTTVLAVLLATTGSLFMVRGRMRGKGLWQGLFMMPLIMPDLILGMSSLVFFAVLQMPLGLVSMILAHSTFAFSYAYILIRNRLDGFDLRLEEAGFDLGASSLQVLWRITWPLCWPAILGAGMTAFALSFDDFLISFFTAGVSSDTLPMRLYAMVKYGFDGETYALSSFILLLTVPLIAGALFLQDYRHSSARIRRKPSR